MSLNSFEELQCWQAARELRIFVKDSVVKNIPQIEKFDLISQIKRSSRSVGNNIAEGFGRFNYQENIQFCRIARGSLFETLDHCFVALEEDYITEEVVSNYRNIHNKTLKILNGYIKYLQQRKSTETK